ncbi:MAG: hypothetical protein HY727_15300 [Candidatus Rokubacteria bacterium]|nr:hypothetical protein [Candidatus Rokubacteria bacterium]
MRYIIVVLMASLLALAASPGSAQQVDITTTPPPAERERQLIPPGRDEPTRPSDTDYYPQGPRVRHDPAFIRPLSVERRTPTSTGRVGMSGWTSPNTPVGGSLNGYSEVNGWFSLGFTFTWDGPPPPATPAR